MCMRCKGPPCLNFYTKIPECDWENIDCMWSIQRSSINSMVCFKRMRMAAYSWSNYMIQKKELLEWNSRHWQEVIRYYTMPLLAQADNQQASSVVLSASIIERLNSKLSSASPIWRARVILRLVSQEGKFRRASMWTILLRSESRPASRLPHVGNQV